MKLSNISVLDGLIIGRIDPHIYAFKTNTIPNYLKVGDTYRPVSVRISEWREIYKNLVHEDKWEWIAKTSNNQYFRDYSVHEHLEKQQGLYRLQPNDIEEGIYYSREFFLNATAENVEKAINDLVNDVFYTNAGTGDFKYVLKGIPSDYTQLEYIEVCGKQTQNQVRVFKESGPNQFYIHYKP